MQGFAPVLLVADTTGGTHSFPALDNVDGVTGPAGQRTYYLAPAVWADFVAAMVAEAHPNGDAPCPSDHPSPCSVCDDIRRTVPDTNGLYPLPTSTQGGWHLFPATCDCHGSDCNRHPADDRCGSSAVRPAPDPAVDLYYCDDCEPDDDNGDPCADCARSYGPHAACRCEA